MIREYNLNYISNVAKLCRIKEKAIDGDVVVVSKYLMYSFSLIYLFLEIIFLFIFLLLRLQIHSLLDYNIVTYMLLHLSNLTFILHLFIYFNFS